MKKAITVIIILISLNVNVQAQKVVKVTVKITRVIKLAKLCYDTYTYYFRKSYVKKP